MKNQLIKLILIMPLLVASAICFGQEDKSSGSVPKKEIASDVREDRDIENAGGGAPNEPSAAAKQIIVDEIKAQLATMATKQLKELIAFCKKNSILGDFVVDLTLEGKGKVVTVFMVSGGEDNIPKKNLLKNKLSQLQFDNVKIPKKQRVKSRYTLKF